MAFLKILITLILIYYLGKLILRAAFPFLFRGYVENINDKMRRQQEETKTRQKKQSEGDVTINYKPKGNKNIGKDEGDYVDFEEIK